MDTSEKIKKIVKELYDWEHILSDSYAYWCGLKPEQVQETLEEVAKDILKAINEY